MTVAELIKKLEHFNADMTVSVSKDISGESRTEAFEVMVIEGDCVIVSDEE